MTSGRHATPSRSRSATLIATGAVFAATGPLLAVTAPAQAEITGPQHVVPAPVLSAPAPVTVKASTTATVRPATYTVKPGDTLTGIARKIYGDRVDWLAFWQANAHRVHNPDYILPGKQLLTPAILPTHITVRVKPKAVAAPVTHTVSDTTVRPSTAASATHETFGGIYSQSMLGSIWLEAGGSSAAEGTAECIAEHESGGNPSAVSPTDDFGLWQINGSHGAQATLDPLRNAEAAVAISDDGRNWGPWTTAPDCGV